MKSNFAHPPMVPAENICLSRDGVLRLEKHSGVRRIRVARGLVWLTGTPARGDILLSAGEAMELPEQWPFVVQALEGAELCLSAGEAVHESNRLGWWRGLVHSSGFTV
jgi:hypothetical protein